MDLSDSLNQRSGNPNLNPEFTHSFELGHQYQSKPLQLGTTAFFRYTTGQIGYVTVFLPNNVAFSMPQNLSSGYTFGLEFNGAARWGKNFDCSFNVSGYRQVLEGGEAFAGLTNQNWNLNSRITLNYRLPADFRLQNMSVA